jgi:5-(carboxyamino)imidazole ribonucleotide synthase
MLALAGYQLGVQFRFFDPSSGAPVGQIGELVAAEYGDDVALERFLDGVDVVTYEFESIPIDTLRFVAERVGVFPPPKALQIAQDRLLEKQLFRDLDIPVPEFSPVDTLDQLRKAASAIGFPAMLKTRRMGYDGKGQVMIRDADMLGGAWERFGGVPAILEEYVPFQHEISTIGVRDRNGREEFYPPVENVHREGILRTTVFPASHLGEEMRELAIVYCGRIMERLEYVGVLALELFSIDGKILANEMAPRVHNSGHWTIEGAETSQFENHLRAVLSLPLGPTTPRGRAAAMINIIGQIPSRELVLAVEGAHLHLYGKAPTERRKLGHVTLVADSADTIERGIAALSQVLAIS